VILSCATNQSSEDRGKKKKFVADITLVGTKADRDYHYPFVSRFITWEKTLVYLAANHEVKEISRTFILIREILEYFKPDLVILEGFRTTAELSPKWYLEHAKSCWGRVYKRKCVEPSYGAYHANKLGIPFVGGEPAPKAIWKIINGKGFFLEDLLGFYVLRIIPQLKQEKHVSYNFRAQVEKMIKRHIKNLDMKNFEYSYQDFTAWYERKTGRVFNKKDITRRLLSPNIKDKPNFFQKLAQKASVARDTHIMKLIADSMNRYNNVLIIYGGGHYMRQKNSIEKMMGVKAKESEYYLDPPPSNMYRTPEGIIKLKK
jgi:hypothetical protein